MNTIDYIANGQNVQFSKKAVTIDGKEFPYIGMSAIKHSSARQLYLFKYEDQWQKLSYNKEDEQKLKTLFSRIAQLNAKRAAEAAKAAKAEEQAAPAPAEAAPAAEAPAEAVKPAEAAVTEAAPAPEHTLSASDIESAIMSSYAPPAEREAAAKAEAAAAAAGDAETPAVEKPAGETIETAAKTAAAETVPAETAAPAEGKASEEDMTAEEMIAAAEAAEAEPMQSDFLPPDEKKIKLKKGFKIFAAVIALFIVLAIVYFFVIGTSDNPNVGPNSNETQQYDDIDGLIEDLQQE